MPACQKMKRCWTCLCETICGHGGCLTKDSKPIKFGKIRAAKSWLAGFNLTRDPLKHEMLAKLKTHHIIKLTVSWSHPLLEPIFPFLVGHDFGIGRTTPSKRIVWCYSHRDYIRIERFWRDSLLQGLSATLSEVCSCFLHFPALPLITC